MTLDADLEKARALVEKWQGKADTAHDEAARLDQEAAAAFLDDPGSAEKLTTKALVKEREARAYSKAAAEAQERVSGVYRKHLEAERRRLEKVSRDAEAAVEKHEKKLDSLLAQLRELEGTEFEAKPTEVTSDTATMPSGTVVRLARPFTTTEELVSEAHVVASQLDLVTRYLELGRMPTAADGYTERGLERTPVLARVIADEITF